MVFVVSEGAVRSLSRPSLVPVTTVRLAPDYAPDYAAIWKTQPAVRTSVSFLARNIASLGIHVFERVSDTDRKRLTDHPLAILLGKPNPRTTRYRFINALVHDLGIYDTAYWLKVKDAGLVRLPPQRVKPVGENWLWPDQFEVRGTKGVRKFDADELVYFRGYNPEEDLGASPIESLRRVLAEEYEAGRMREQVLRNGARVSGYLTRPAEASNWSDDARTRFGRAWKSQYAGGGPEAGGTPILEDGMTFVPASQTAEQLQYIESRKLTREEVASAFFIPPPMIGLLDNATFSNITEQHKMLYQDTLGPWLTMIVEELSLQLLPDMGATANVYVEFNLAEKLRGSFEEQAGQLQTSVGAPWLTRNEARARQNLPQIEGGDELVVPLNVLIGGQASPNDGVTEGGGGAVPTGDDLKQRVEAAAALIRSGFDPAGALEAVGLDPILHLGLLPVTVQRPQEPENVDQEAVDALKRIPGRWLVKARAAAPYAAKCEQVLSAFFGRQERAVLSALGSKAPGWWDEARWDRELADDLFALALTITPAVAKDVLDGLGFGPDAYNVGQTEKFLKAVAKSRAGAINSTTRDRITAALDAGTDAAAVFEEARSARAPQGAATLVTTFSAFATTEAAKQSTGDRATKTWVVASRNPRASHAAMNGETVGIDDVFSNGMNWPGDPAGGADEVAGCMCGVEINVP